MKKNPKLAFESSINPFLGSISFITCAGLYKKNLALGKSGCFLFFFFCRNLLIVFKVRIRLSCSCFSVVYGLSGVLFVGSSFNLFDPVITGSSCSSLIVLSSSQLFVLFS